MSLNVSNWQNLKNGKWPYFENTYKKQKCYGTLSQQTLKVQESKVYFVLISQDMAIFWCLRLKSQSKYQKITTSKKRGHISKERTYFKILILSQPNPTSTLPNPPHPHTLPKLAIWETSNRWHCPAPAWCEADIRLSEELATEGYRQVQEGRRGYARVRGKVMF